ncbi:methyltransferase domain-containing protein [Actinomadura macrotermitis]|uniref:Protein-L-isoaspartate O-methyltransferase n=1 Tax=Actinomadura macrotermitis TaxID=2585200 RepID=A0A7K0BSP5_9ACTN|nr:methyltransferase domain-containing protein [Actinomadura macrotermitis]MQY04225.1 Protein-L-isoaspartate O-methyltransferase [Actinomadura macrotermitis]
MEDVTQRLDALVARLAAAGWLTQEPVRAALRGVPRHLFVPPVAWTGDGGRVHRRTDPERWLDLAYGDDAIITQLDDGATDLDTGQGRFTSSLSAPSTVVSLLELLDVEPGHRVLDVGTGTGWTAALLSRLAGAENVTSVEIDPQVSERAAANLKAAGCSPRLLVEDGAQGWAPGAPYDRVHATCAVARVPYAWVEQTRPGGVIVAPYDPGFGSSHEVRLVVLPDGTAIGRFTGYASYMMMRSQRHPEWDDFLSEATRSTTFVDPRTLGYAPAGADLAMGAALPGVRARGIHDGDRYTLRLWGPDSWATARYEPGREVYEVEQAGSRALWDLAVSAYFAWVVQRSPGRDRFGVTVTPDGDHIWLDQPVN